MNNSVGCPIDKRPLTLEPNWLSVSKFEAETTILGKLSRVTNNFVFGAGLFGLYTFATGGTGVVAYASYLSIGLAARKIASASIGYLVYPAANPFGDRERIKKQGENQIFNLKAKGCITRKISLYKSGIRYDAVLVTHQKTIRNGNWTINALGNCMTMESSVYQLAKENFKNRCNTLLINGPSVSQSGGWPTRYQMGAGFEAGLRFLEQEVQATHILMRGFSLGGGMLGEAILNHKFKRDTRYLLISDRSFNRLSTIAGALAGAFVKPILRLIGMELDGVGAARKLSQLGISQIVIQHTSKDGAGSDGIIPDNSSLAYELHKDKNLKNKFFLESELITHNGELPEEIKKGLIHQIQKFIKS